MQSNDGETVSVDAATLSILWACARILEQGRNLEGLVAVFLLHWALLPHLPLQLRAQKASPVASPREESSRFLDQIYRELLHVTTKETLEQLRSVTSRPVESTGESCISRCAAVQVENPTEWEAEGKCELLDFGDGRLFHFLARRYLSADADGDVTSAPSAKAVRTCVVPEDVACRVRWLWAVVSAGARKVEAGERGPEFPLALRVEEPGTFFAAGVETGREPRGHDADQGFDLETGPADGLGERCLEVCDCAAKAGANEVKSDLVLLPIHGNELVTAFLGDGALSLPHYRDDARVVRELGSGSAHFDETFHWHTGQPLEDSYWQEASKEYTKVHNMSAKSLMSHPAFRGRYYQRVLEAFHIGTKTTEKDLTLREWALAELRKKRERNEQFSARALHRYAASLSGTKFCAPTGVITEHKRGRSAGKPSASSSSGDHSTGGSRKDVAVGKKAKAPSKKELIIAGNLERKAGTEKAKLREQWNARQKALGARALSAREAAELEEFMRSCGAFPDLMFDVAGIYVEGCMKSWREVRGGGRKRTGPSRSGEKGISEPFTEGSDSARVWPAVAVFQLAHTLLEDYADALKSQGGDEAKLLVGSITKAFETFGFYEEARHIGLGLISAPEASSEQKAKGKKGRASKGGSASEPEPTPRQAGAAESALILGMSAVRFQLQYMGHLLPKCSASERASRPRDARVGSLVADPWQSRVLDVVDSKGSALVCAPTSSGKTLISGYCMRNVLSEDDVGIVVFVAPTKALVNQVRAQVAKDFGADVPGVFTRDFYVRPLESRVLVTVPACLEILLLSPTATYGTWREKLRYVIFDEIHCIGELENGDLWEHLMLLIRCPFLALSATVNNPREFQGWLQGAKDHQKRQDAARGNMGTDGQYKVHLIEHHERHADLEKFQYLPKSISTEPEADLPARNAIISTSVPAFRPFHPFASLEPNRLREEGFPGDMSLSPPATLQLFDAMTSILGQPRTAGPPDPDSPRSATGGEGVTERRAASQFGEPGGVPGWRETARLRLERTLAPEVFFQGSARITRPRVREYEAALKQEMLIWARDVSSSAAQGEGPKAVQGRLLQTPGSADLSLAQRTQCDGSDGFRALDELLRALNGDLSARVRALEEECASRGVQIERDFLGRDIMSLLLGLAAQDWLPALVFNFSRGQCMDMALRVVERLERAEAEAEKARLHQSVFHFSGNVEKANFGDRSADKVKSQLLERKRKEDKQRRDKAKHNRGDDEDQGFAIAEEEDELLCNADFTFVKTRERMPLEELRELLDPVIESFDEGLDHFLIRGLIRGVGVHHAGLSTKYRQVVEILFRAKHLRVVFATGTLAYGINMPCSTVVFAGDSIFLDPLQFRQMSGRAGRRGFDSVGRVVFFGVPTDKLKSLLTSAVPDLRGHFPLSVTLVLRLLLLEATGVVGRESTRDAMVRLLSNPLYASGGRPELRQQMKHLFRFSLELLMRAQLLSTVGRPLGLAGLAVHLFWSEPANMAFVYLLRNGLFHQVCDDRGWYTVSRELLLICAHMFMRKRLHPLMAKRAKQNQSPSMIVLPPLPPFIESALAAHNDEALRTFSQYIVSYARAHADTLPDPCVLPVSGIGYPSLKKSDGVRAAAPRLTSSSRQQRVTPLLGSLRRDAVIFSACSPFVALSGCGDRFRTARDLVRHVRTGLHVNESAMPVLDTAGSAHVAVRLNAYVLDFFAHGQKEALVAGNGLLEGDAYEGLKTFVMVLRTIATALGKLGPEEEELGRGDPVVAAFERLALEYQTKFFKFNG
ncbi:hypothetical protein KFL_000060450 [Klebsormidium nitens]|uniref:Uncharacterized protein n=1 Tax=Klebsormidium nitens TaxID=105231 RepID=A0A0U9HHT1_KLENI|nr:hypothetical protein KFL_000060450 [Klebsormidium nitens]|eukprot:GAQ77980.1 hypothetical protein KFL_000060450 [Klebsormidium nitens]